MPLSHAPGHAQCDFGEALVVIGGVQQKAHCFVIDLPHSDGCFVKAYRRRPPRPSWTDTCRRSPFWGESPLTGVCIWCFQLRDGRLSSAQPAGRAVAREVTRAFCLSV